MHCGYADRYAHQAGSGTERWWRRWAWSLDLRIAVNHRVYIPFRNASSKTVPTRTLLGACFPVDHATPSRIQKASLSTHPSIKISKHCRHHPRSITSPKQTEALGQVLAVGVRTPRLPLYDTLGLIERDAQRFSLSVSVRFRRYSSKGNEDVYVPPSLEPFRPRPRRCRSWRSCP